MPGNPKFRERFEHLSELISLHRCPVHLDDSEATARIAVAAKSIEDRAWALGRPLLRELINANAEDMFDQQAQEGRAGGFRVEASVGEDASLDDLHRAVHTQLQLHEWFKAVIPIIQRPAE